MLRWETRRAERQRARVAEAAEHQHGGANQCEEDRKRQQRQARDL
jgi:hypothetical protein